MAHEPYTRTNQKIYFAGLALEALRRAEQGSVPGAVQAEREAALFHLYGALLGLCHEIAIFYRLPDARTMRAENLLKPALLAEAPSPELGELIELASVPDTWLGQLLSAYTALFMPPQEPSRAKVDPAVPLIHAVSLDERTPGGEELGSEILESWRKHLKALALRFREGLTEC